MMRDTSHARAASLLKRRIAENEASGVSRLDGWTGQSAEEHEKRYCIAKYNIVRYAVLLSPTVIRGSITAMAVVII